MSYATSKYLIYTCFESKRTEHESTIAGNLLLDHADTLEEAEEKVQMYKQRGNEYDAKIDSREYYSSKTRYIHIENRPEWWPENRRT
jgi:hypothetical protein